MTAAWMPYRVNDGGWRYKVDRLSQQKHCKPFDKCRKVPRSPVSADRIRALPLQRSNSGQIQASISCPESIGESGVRTSGRHISPTFAAADEVIEEDASFSRIPRQNKVTITTHPLQQQTLPHRHPHSRPPSILHVHSYGNRGMWKRARTEI